MVEATAAAVEVEAEYHDGQQGRRLPVRARLTPSTLELRGAGGEAVASWPVAALRVVDRAGGALRLAPDGSDARLIVPDAAPFAAALHAAQAPRRRAALKRGLRMAALAAVAVPAGAFALWKGWPPAADAIARAVPAEWESSVGTAAASALIGDKRVCGGPAGQAALDALAARLAAAGGGVAAPGLRVRVVDDATVNALAAPGGEVVVFRGLLDKAGSPEELAGVLAHELAHVRHRHGLRSAARVAGLFVLTGALTGGSDAIAAVAALVGLSYSREFEREADADGARTLHAAGIGTDGLRAFFARLEGDESRAARGSFWAYVNTHPTDTERVSALRSAAAERPAFPAPAMAAAEWAAVRAICGAAAGAPRPVARSGAAPARAPDRAAAAATPGAASPARRRLGVFGAWEAWAGEEHGGPVCFAFVDGSSPAPVGAAAAEGSKARLWVTHRPGRGMDGVAFVPDRRPPEGAAVEIAFGGRGAPVRMLGAHGSPSDGAALSAALRAAAAEGVAEAVVGWAGAGSEPAAAAPEGRSYGFALDGFAEAHVAIGAACAAEAPPTAPAR